MFKVMSAALAFSMSAICQANAYDCSEQTYQHAHLKIVLAFGTGILQTILAAEFQSS